MSRFIPVIFCALLLFDIRGREKGKGRNMYIFLSVLTVIASFVAAYLAAEDHIGASLSGMISIFMR